MSNITQVFNDEKNLVSMNRSIMASGLDKVLSEEGPFTVFAPSDLAFGKLQRGAMEFLLDSGNKIKLVEIVNRHIVRRKINFDEFKDGQTLKPLYGEDLLVRVINAKVTINGAAIQNRDIASSNGVIHSLDALLKINLE
jgi:uncharacterized surface protein with fasciclin (FAS1) repeats